MELEFERYVDSAGWSLSYPRGLRVARSNADAPYPMSEVMITSFVPAAGGRSPRDTDPPLDERGRFPPGAVALRLTRPECHDGASASLDAPESAFPIRLSTFALTHAGDRDRPAQLTRSIAANGESYRAHAWIARDASPVARAALEHVVSSLSFPPLEPGAVLYSGFTVQAKAADYPVSSFTEVRAGDRPLYLVHAPGGFYALGWLRTGPSIYRDSCTHHIDPERLEVYCAECPAGWDRIGRVIRRPQAADGDDWLHLSVAKVAWDGHVLVHPRTYQRPSAPNARNFWPDWAAAD